PLFDQHHADPGDGAEDAGGDGAGPVAVQLGDEAAVGLETEEAGPVGGRLVPAGLLLQPQAQREVLERHPADVDHGSCPAPAQRRPGSRTPLPFRLVAESPRSSRALSASSRSRLTTSGYFSATSVVSPGSFSRSNRARPIFRRWPRPGLPSRPG